MTNVKFSIYQTHFVRLIACRVLYVKLPGSYRDTFWLGFGAGLEFDSA